MYYYCRNKENMKELFNQIEELTSEWEAVINLGGKDLYVCGEAIVSRESETDWIDGERVFSIAENLEHAEVWGVMWGNMTELNPKVEEAMKIYLNKQIDINYNW